MNTRYFTWLAGTAFIWMFIACSGPSRVSAKPKKLANSDDKIIADMRKQGLDKPEHFYLSEINSNAMRNFVGSYSQATNPRWVKYYGGFVVYFSLDETRYKVYYTRTGFVKCIIRQYSTATMPIEIRHMVEESYDDYTILLVSEITTKDKTRYEIKIEDETSFKEIKIEDGGMKVTNAFVKSR